MAKQNTNPKQGFTIIEVVLVLAVAGLLLLMVFVALPSLQRSQRDTQRRNDMGRLITAVQNYRANNGNKSPIIFTNFSTKPAGGRTWYDVYTFTDGFKDNYLKIDGDEFKDPSTGADYAFGDFEFKDPSTGVDYVFDAFECAITDNVQADDGQACAFPKDLVEGAIMVFVGARCAGQEAVHVGNGALNINRLAFIIKLEGAGTYCVDV